MTLKDGLLLLELKGDVNYRPKTRQFSHYGCCEISYKVFNFTEDQDLKLKIGFGSGDKVYICTYVQKTFSSIHFILGVSK